MSTTLKPGTRVQYLVYGVPTTGVVTHQDSSVVWVRDDGRTDERWLHPISLEAITTAQLIAAAPDMLAALKDAETALAAEADNRQEAGADMTDYLTEILEPLATVRSAIAKAEGRAE